MKIAYALAGLLLAAQANGQAAPAKPSAAAPATPPAQPLQLQGLAPTVRADPFPPVDPKNFNTDTPSVATVESYLHAVLGYDANRVWKVLAIEKTPAPGVSRVVTGIADRTGTAKMSTAVLYILPDGKHLIAPDSQGGQVSSFGATPYADVQTMLSQRATGATTGSAAKTLELVEFTDLQCPRCKEAEATMSRLESDFPQARIVIANLPLTQIHPYALQAAEYGVCVAQKSNDAWFKYAQAVYNNQNGLVPESADATLKSAVTEAGQDPAAIAACAATPQTKAAVEASMQLAKDAGIDQTPMLVANGRALPLVGLPYDTLHAVVAFQAGQTGLSPASTRPAPTLK